MQHHLQAPRSIFDLSANSESLADCLIDQEQCIYCQCCSKNLKPAGITFPSFDDFPPGYDQPFQKKPFFHENLLFQDQLPLLPKAPRNFTPSYKLGPFFDDQKKKLAPFVDTRNLTGRPKISDVQLCFEDSDAEPGRLGKGTFSVVNRVQFKPSLFQKSENQPFALKILKKSEHIPYRMEAANRQKSDINEIHMELYCLEKIPKHPNLVSSIFTIQDEYQVYIGLELKYSNLREFAEESDFLSNPRQSFQVLACLFRQVFEGVAHLHDLGILHLDLKDSNLLLDERSGAPTIQVADFGLARFAPTWGRIGTEGYMAPEVADSCSEATYSYPADVYSLGKTVEKVFCLAFGVEDTGVGLRDLIGSTACKYLNDLLLDSSNFHPDNRPSVRQLLESPFFKRNIF